MARFWGWRFKEKPTQKNTQKRTPKQRKLGGESDENQFQKNTQIVQPTIQRRTPENAQARGGERKLSLQTSNN